MRIPAKTIGVIWICACLAAGALLGFGQWQLSWPGILFASGFGDVWIIGLLGVPGVLLYNWGSPHQRFR